MVDRGQGVGTGWKRWRDWEVQTGGYRIVMDVKSSTGNVVNNSVITMYCARWVLELSGGPLCKAHDCLTTMLYTWNEYKIIVNINCNIKIKIITIKERKPSAEGSVGSSWNQLDHWQCPEACEEEQGRYRNVDHGQAPRVHFGEGQVSAET